MDFCDDCDNMLYIQKNGNKLNLVCKICGFQKLYDKQDKCIYVKNYKSDHLSFKTVSNRFVHLDPTLPRVNNINCPNKECDTNKKAIDFQNIYIIRNIPYYIYDDFMTKLDQYTKLKDIQDEQFRPYNFELKSDLKKDNIVIKVTAIPSDIPIPKITVALVKKLVSQISIKDKQEELNKLKNNIKPYKKPKNEVVFIKYDSNHMKYLYICCNCKFSWKND